MLKKDIDTRVSGHGMTIKHVKPRLYDIRFAVNGTLDDLMLKALEELPSEVLHPKVKLLKKLLQVPKHEILSTNIASSRATFFKYLNNNLEDNLLLVLGQDLHGLRLDSLNAILSFAGFATLTNIKQFDLTQFKEKAEKLKAQEGPKTEKQVLFLKYFAN